MITIALVGCAHIHTPGFIKRIVARENIKVKSVWDHDAARAAKSAAELKSTTTTDLASIWNDREITAVVICSETNRHEDLVLPAVNAKKHLFVEKPLGFAAKDANAMAAAIEKAGVMFQTGYFMRGNPINQFLRKQIQSGAFGKISRIHASTAHEGSLGKWFDTDWRWMADPAIAGCGAFGDLGTHSLDIMLWLMGEVSSCTAMLDNGTARYPGCDETGQGLMKFKNDAIGVLSAGWVDLANPVTMMISGTEAHAIVFRDKLYFKCPKQSLGGENPHTDLSAAAPSGFEAFLDAITGKSDVQLVAAREAAYRSAVMSAMYDGAKGQKWVAP